MKLETGEKIALSKRSKFASAPLYRSNRDTAKRDDVGTGQGCRDRAVVAPAGQIDLSTHLVCPGDDFPVVGLSSQRQSGLAGGLRKIVTAAGLKAGEWTPRELGDSFVSLPSDDGMPIEHMAPPGRPHQHSDDRDRVPAADPARHRLGRRSHGSDLRAYGPS